MEPPFILVLELNLELSFKVLSLNDKSKAISKNRLSEVKFLFINELSVVSNDSCTVINSRLEEIFIMIPEK